MVNPYWSECPVCKSLAAQYDEYRYFCYSCGNDLVVKDNKLKQINSCMEVK